MKKQSDNFEIEFLDHVAIRVKSIEVSADWYERVLGLKKYQLPKWGKYPIFMMSNTSGVALFPAELADEKLDKNSKNIGIDHFAFNVTNENFEIAKNRYLSLGLNFTIKDHYYYHSMYTKDPDGHNVELTTLMVNSKDFYK
ncbi:VOC family protein [uncultured Maribacter sp.]|uniref:VOC family protein n=1 Tax=uncultured Maribacter sp. TaxID=431308 RepID=UPI0030EEB0AF|tara:strand:+ start:69527 stop:69949 length:423 start_codon:yes stop_codon:yes gene_type:complete